MTPDQCCAHLHVSYLTSDASGVTRGWWACDDCDHKFMPVPAAPLYKRGDRVLWDTGGWWGKKPATVLALSKSGQKVRIETDTHPQHNGGRAWITYVTLAKLEPHP